MDKQLRIVFGDDTVKHLEIIQRYFLDVDGMWISKNEVFRRAVLILANEITKGEESAKGVISE